MGGAEHHGVSRRELLRRLGITGAAVIVGPSLLAACGDDDDQSDRKSVV